MRRRSAVLAVLAVIAAFLGMHSLAMPSHGAAPASVASFGMTEHVSAPTAETMAMGDAAMNPTGAGAAMNATDAGAASASDPMLGMACAMALLLAAAGIVLARARVTLAPRHDALRWEHDSAPVVSFAGHPPSLTLLSISRT